MCAVPSPASPPASNAAARALTPDHHIPPGTHDLTPHRPVRLRRRPGRPPARHLDQRHAQYADQIPRTEQLWDAAHVENIVSQYVLTHDAVIHGPADLRL